MRRKIIERIRRVLGNEALSSEPAVLRAQIDELRAQIDELRPQSDGRNSSRPGSGSAEQIDAELNARAIIERTLWMVRTEYTVMPRFGFHQPLDYDLDTVPARFEPPLRVEGEELLVPAPHDRMGYSPNDTDFYLKWGRSDKDLVAAQINKHLGKIKDVAILDFGCSSGRVLRHFYRAVKEFNWSLYGVDIQARPIQWMRQFLPREFCVYTGSTTPALPFPDNHFDVIYGFSVFTHIKFNCDFWLLELKRVMKPGGLLIQTIHTENA
jgi:SAM-dependent methyltransferase